MRFYSLIASAILVASATTATVAQTKYPARSVQIICDTPVGSAPDVGLRIVAEGLSKHWGVPVVVINHPGAAGAISARVAAAAASDGYTLYAPALSAFLDLPGRASNLPLHIPRDFTAIGFTVEQPMSFGVSHKLGVKTLPELIAEAKKRPGEISYAVTGIGRLTHLAGELLKMRAGIDLQVIPYTGGSAQAMGDIVSGRVSMIIEGYTSMSSHYKAGTLRPVAVSSAERIPDAPDLPAVSETYPGFIAAGWQIIVAPKGTPDTIISQASDDLKTVLAQPDVRKKLAVLGSFVRPMSAADTTAFVQDQQKTWAPVMERIIAQTKKKR